MSGLLTALGYAATCILATISGKDSTRFWLWLWISMDAITAIASVAFGQPPRIAAVLAIIPIAIYLLVQDRQIGWLVILAAPAILWGSQLRDDALRSSGRRAHATILEITDTGVTVGTSAMFKIKLRVQPTNESPYDTWSTISVSRPEQSYLQPGQTVPVRIDPAHRDRVTLE